ncbi:hypothetical protein Tco_0802700 [Tanacetum coccineum]|uniref:Transposase MuDR plant domain-containing protein n=1 Tax=Tanacetum coccineum TaxID=301880 RepID=A0ABQ5A0G6_9ASTR
MRNCGGGGEHTRIKAELDSSDDDYHYFDDDLEEIENVDFHTEGDDSVVIKNITTQDPFLTKLYASWMSMEHSFQIKLLRSEHKCCRNYNLGSLVTYKWIAVQYFKEIIEDPFIPLRKMRDDIRQKFMINYRQAILDSNPGSTCTLDVVESDNGSVSFKRMYICFKGVKDGWLAGCRKGLIDAVNDWLPEAEHRKCTRHIYANFKKKYSGLQYQRLFWAAASCTLEQQFLQIMDQIKLLDANAYDYLIQRDPNSWSRAFFEMDRRCAAFENGISEMAMNKLAFSLEDTITPSIRKRLRGYIKERTRGGDKSGRCDGNDGSGSGSGVIDGSGSGSVVNDGSGNGGRGGGRAGGRGKRGGGKGGRAIAQAKIDAEQEEMDKERREEQEWQEKNDYFNPANWQEESMEEAHMNQQYHEVLIPSIHSQPTQQSGVWVVDTTVSVADVDEAPEQETSDDGPAPEQGKSLAMDKVKAKASVEDGPAPKNKKGRPPSNVDGIRIYHKNRGRSERIDNMKSNKLF